MGTSAEPPWPSRHVPKPWDVGVGDDSCALQPRADVCVHCTGFNVAGLRFTSSDGLALPLDRFAGH